MSELSSEFFKTNRRRLREQLPLNSVALIPAHTRVQRSGEVTFPFKQNNYFYYLCGVEQPDLILVIAKNGEELLITPNYNQFNRIWEVGLSKEQLVNISGIQKVMSRKEARTSLQKLIKGNTKILSILPSVKQHLMPSSNPAIRANLKWIHEQWPAKKIGDVRPLVVGQRMVKQPPEIKLIQRAIDITGAGLKKVKAAIGDKVTELELDRLLRAQFLLNGADDIGFENLVSAGANACVIHYDAKHSACKKGELVLFDVGAELSGYTADITRVYPVSGKMSSRQQEIYQAVLELQSTAMKLLRPGVRIKDYETQVEQLMGKALVRLGLITNPIRKHIRHYYPTATSHHMGLDVHDVADYTEPLKPNMVLTVEPGIYVPEEGIGVRLEDDILITKTGNQNLSSSIPK